MKRIGVRLRVALSNEAETALVERCRNGDSAAYRLLFDTFSDRVFSTAVRILGNMQDAEDAAQETFLKVFGGLDSFRRESSLVTWIYRITVNASLDILRKRNHGAEEPLDGADDSGVMPDDRTHGPDSFSGILEMEIRKLPKRCRAVFILYAIEGLKHEEIASVLGVTAGTSKSQYFLAKSILRKRLSQRKGITADGP